MATLERKKKPAALSIQQQQEEEVEEQDEHQITEESTSIQQNDDMITNDPILESLSKEPMEYSAVCCLSNEVVQSLQSVKHICLNVLDLLLLQIVKDLPRGHHQRRLSDQSIGATVATAGAEDLLGSITQNTNILQSTSMIRSKSSPPAIAATSIADVYRILDKHQPLNSIDNQDYTLCCSLAALLNDVYRLLELNSVHQQQHQQPQQEERETFSDSNDVSALQQQLHDKVSNFQLKRAQGIMTMDEADASQEMIMIWDEMDHLMNIVTGLAKPPNYADLHAPPAYESLVIEQEHIDLQEKDMKKDSTGTTTTAPINDLDKLLSAIDRLSHVAPRLNDQRVDMNEKQIKELAAATLGRTVERLSRGRMEDQRAPLPLKTKQEVLQDLIQQIHKSASRSLDNQRVSITMSQQRKMDIASIRGIIDKLDKGRYTDQDWISHEELLINDLTHTTDLLVKSLNRPAYNRQRFSMSATKERSLFISGLFNKVESLEGYRLANQDAELQNNSNEENDDLHQLLNHIYKSKPQLDNQRASFS